MKIKSRNTGIRYLIQLLSSVIILFCLVSCSSDDLTPSISFIEKSDHVSSNCTLPLNTDITVGFRASSNLETSTPLEVLSINITHNGEDHYHSVTYTTENTLDHDVYFKVSEPGQYVVTGTITDENRYSASISLTITVK